MRDAVCGLLVVAALSSPAWAQQVRAPTTNELSAFDVATATVATLDVPNSLDGALDIEVPLGDELVTLVVAPHSLRGPSFQLLVQDATGALVPTVAPAVATFRGYVEGVADSLVAGSLVDGELDIIVRRAADEPLWAVQHVAGREHVIFNDADTIDPGGICGALEERAHHHGAGAQYAGTQLSVAELAIDSDFEFYTSNGSSVTATEQDIENVLNGVDVIYQNEVGISFEITAIIVRTSEPDPYTSTNNSTLLSQFRNHWQSSQQSIPRDVAQLFTGKNLDGSVIGTAYLNGICNSFGYGHVQSKYTGSLTLRTRLSAHELGHNWGASHCNGQSGCGIMCSGGCGSPTEFGPTSTNSINATKGSVTCLGDPPLMTLSAIDTPVVASLDALTVELTGTDLTFAQEVLVDSGNGPQSVNVISSTPSTLQFLAPQPFSLGTATVQVSNSTGPSNSLAMEYVANDPPKLTVPTIALTGDTLQWTYGSDAGETAYLLISLDGTTFPFGGTNVLLNYVILNAASVDAAGISGFSVELPASASGLTFRSQAVFLDGGGFTGATSIISTWVIL